MKLLKYLTGQSWTLGGVGLVLITLSGKTRSTGFWISVAALVAGIAGALLPGGEDK